MSAVTGIPKMRLYDATDSLLRFAMRVDATLTGLCGLAAALFADPLAELTGLSSNLHFAVGAVFVFYGLTVYGLTGLQDLRSVGVGVVVANIVLTLLAFGAVEALPMTATGVGMAVALGLVTAALAWLQYRGLRRLPA
ncbi:hypothetical protein [Mycobacterium sherrisii]|uniref:Integral membrane protein n=1 Tax=Mycobacterium sherrisii TaxID=243061 RepID=A0A1E3SNP0_9MYCO|nr:hypothetical protein [Mycobacterium sherrisii]MCV7031475.1 hypothetical protein [Mycobacterium sherrisii]ODR03805.1 hypothetical protein BHQ21_20070 [Mycobacterium sherrisii]ORW73984.1 hypothetical protein AWC25_17040 [Mycobacterium sherrisii]